MQNRQTTLYTNRETRNLLESVSDSLGLGLSPAVVLALRVVDFIMKDQKDAAVMAVRDALVEHNPHHPLIVPFSAVPLADEAPF